MSRELTAGITTALTTQGSYFGWLLMITLNTGQALRYTSLDAGFDYGGYTWQSVDMDMPDLSWDGTIMKPGVLVLGDADRQFWAMVNNLSIADARVALFAIYAAASGEAEPVWAGRVGKCSIKDLTLQVELTNGSDLISVPRRRIQYVINAAFLLPGGTSIDMSNQHYIITRPVTSA
jgi:hypothetical protein